MNQDSEEETSAQIAERFITSKELHAEDLWDNAESMFEDACLGFETLDLKGGIPGPRYFRGQADSKYGISSSLHRHLKAALSEITGERDPEVTESQMMAAESMLLEEMRREGLGLGCSDLELLCLLQHHWFPTRLVDVSRSPEPALFFATNEHPERDGRLFVIQASDAYKTGAHMAQLPWAGKVTGSTKVDGDWTDTVAVIDGAPIDPRMIAQSGTFLVGGLTKSGKGRNYHLPLADSGTGKLQYALNARQKQSVSTLHLAFPTYDGDFQNWNGRAWSIRIPQDWKGRLQTNLSGGVNSYTQESVFPPFDACLKLGKRIMTDAIKPS